MQVTKGLSILPYKARIVLTKSKDKFCHDKFLFCLLHQHWKFQIRQIPSPLRTEFPVFWEFSKIHNYANNPCQLNSQFSGNSQKFTIMQITPANWIPSFLGIPRNSIKGMLYKIYQEIYIRVYVYNLKIMKFIVQTKFL